MERVKQLRESLGLTQEAFAERAGLKYKHYQAVEAGRKPNIQFETVLKMARACEVEPWQLLCFDASPQALAEKQAPYDAGVKRKATLSVTPTKRPRKPAAKRRA
jgi:transcriptional regulator with XRE-family HTH domain